MTKIVVKEELWRGTCYSRHKVTIINVLWWVCLWLVMCCFTVWKNYELLKINTIIYICLKLLPSGLKKNYYDEILLFGYILVWIFKWCMTCQGILMYGVDGNFCSVNYYHVVSPHWTQWVACRLVQLTFGRVIWRPSMARGGYKV